MRKLIRKALSLKSSKNAVSEVLGTILLLGVAVAIFSVLYYIVLSEPFDANETYPTIVATYVGDNIIFEHRGGEPQGLDAEVPITIDGNEILINNSTPTVGDLLDDTNGDNLWNIGENLVFNFKKFNYTLNENSEGADAIAIDDEGTEALFIGSLDIHPTSDIGIQCSVNNSSPSINSKIEFTITVSHFRGDLNISDLFVKFLLPEDLEYIGISTNSGSYNNYTGIWELDELGIRKSATLKIYANVTALGYISEFTQLALILDGSVTISDSEWNIVTAGLANAIKNGFIPHNNMLELSIIQFGGGVFWGDDAYAQVEIGPVILEDDNYMDIANMAYVLGQLKGNTPAACGLKLGARTLYYSPNFDPNKRQVINLVTDGLPNCDWDPLDNDNYNGTVFGSWQSAFKKGKARTVDARNYMLGKLSLTEDQDELDSLAIDVKDDNVIWLRDEIVWPQPGYDTWPPAGPGWVRKVDNFNDFAQALNEQFEILFSGMTIEAELIILSPIDINVIINESTVVINPQGEG